MTLDPDDFAPRPGIRPDVHERFKLVWKRALARQDIIYAPAVPTEGTWQPKSASESFD